MKRSPQPFRVRLAERGQEPPLALVDEMCASLQDVVPLAGEAHDVLAAVIGLGLAPDPTLPFFQLVDEGDHRRAVDAEKFCHLCWERPCCSSRQFSAAHWRGPRLQQLEPS